MYRRRNRSTVPRGLIAPCSCPRTVAPMASTTVYRSPELAARIVSLHAVAGEFRQEAVDHGAPYRFTDSKAQKKA